jgi:hypothetical protein
MQWTNVLHTIVRSPPYLRMVQPARAIGSQLSPHRPAAARCRTGSCRLPAKGRGLSAGVGPCFCG